MRRFPRESGACLIAGCLVVISPFAHALDLKAWKASINPQTHERYIPVELWAGAEWDGANALKMPNVDDTYRHRKATYQIKGPMEWEHPAMGRKFLVYERINSGRDGVKWQLFTINQDQNGLGRVYDGRPGRDGRLSSGGLKFPLGLWKEGETRKFIYQVWQSRNQKGSNRSPFKNRFCLSDQSALPRISLDSNQPKWRHDLRSPDLYLLPATKHGESDTALADVAPMSL
jgi:hypothetical protein